MFYGRSRIRDLPNKPFAATWHLWNSLTQLAIHYVGVGDPNQQSAPNRIAPLSLPTYLAREQVPQVEQSLLVTSFNRLPICCFRVPLSSRPIKVEITESTEGLHITRLNGCAERVFSIVH